MDAQFLLWIKERTTTKLNIICSTCWAVLFNGLVPRRSMGLLLKEKRKVGVVFEFTAEITEAGQSSAVNWVKRSNANELTIRSITATMSRLHFAGVMETPFTIEKAGLSPVQNMGGSIVLSYDYMDLGHARALETMAVESAYDFPLLKTDETFLLISHAFLRSTQQRSTVIRECGYTAALCGCPFAAPSWDAGCICRHSYL